MKYHHLLRLSGYGYLRGIIQENNKMIAQIKLVTHFNPSNRGQDDIWIDCEVTDFNHIMFLNCLLNAVRFCDNVAITFEAEYSAFIDAYPGQTAEDPSNIVSLCGKLRTLDACYINGCLVEENKVPLRAIC